MGIRIWFRYCINPTDNPNCKKVIFYTSNSSWNRAEQTKSTCRSCRMIGHRVSEIARHRISKNHADFTGNKNPMYGTKRPDLE